MTIAAGFTFDNGVLLAADTQFTAGITKRFRSKIFHSEDEGGAFGFAYSGNVPFALNAIQRCQEALGGVDPTEVVATVSNVARQEYKCHVLDHPSYAADFSLRYALLFVHCPPGGPARLYVSHETSLRKGEHCECTGIGEEFAYYLVRPTYQPTCDERTVLSLAAYMLARTKENVDGCGGASEFLCLRNDGSAIPAQSLGGTPADIRTPTEWLERSSLEFDAESRRLLFDIADGNVSDEALRKRSEEFQQYVVDLRGDMRSRRLSHESFVNLEGRS